MVRGPLHRRKIALGVGGGIAAYKSCELARELIRKDAIVRVAMTEAAQAFVAPLTFQSLTGHAVLTNYFDPTQEATFGHIELARWAELFVVAPATADLVAKIRTGFASDPVTTSLLAYRGTVLLAPAMNVAMFEHPATQENLTALARSDRYRFVGPEAGLLACGEIGKGRLSDVLDIVKAAETLCGQGPLSGKSVLITAGPTREYLDPVRFLSNPSTGKMGLALAEVARAKGADVTVVLGPVPQVPDAGFEIVQVVSAEEMKGAVLDRVQSCDVFIATAAVSDYRPTQTSAQKLKKGPQDEVLTLTRTPDVLAEASRLVASASRRPLLVGFAAETGQLEERALEKLRSKALDFIVANEVGQPGVGFAADTNRVTVISRDGRAREIAGTKHDVAGAIWDLIAPPP